MSHQQTSPVKTLKQRDLVLFSVSAILLLDTLAASASIGVSSIFWWLFLGIVFFLPFSLICAELGCTYPEQGGIYAWVRDAYGKRWGARTSWAYWVNTAVWIPAIYILFAATFKQLFFPEMGLHAQIGIAIVLTWLSVLVNLVALDVGKWVPNVGAFFKIVVFGVIIVAAFFFAQKNGMANPLSLNSLKPNWGSGLQYIPAIIYGMLGFELVSASSEEMVNPKKDVPRAIFVSGFIIISLYILGSIAVLAAVPSTEINLVEGLIDTLRMLLANINGSEYIVIGLGIAALYTFFSNGVTWALGCNRAACEAAQEKELPAWFGVQSTRQIPIGAPIIMGVTSTLILIVYGFLSTSNEDLFWTLFSFSAVIFLCPYLAMLLAFIKMRIIDSERPRPFKIAGGLTVAKILAYTCFTVLSLTIALFIYVPNEGLQWPVIMGIVITLLIGEAVIIGTRISNKRAK